MSHVVTAPDRNVPEGPSLFIAGGITDCPEWQTEAIAGLSDTDLVLFNPRRATFNVRDPQAAPGQIQWEHEMLRQADAIMFWFCEEALQPIALYELGAWSMTNKPIFVGAHPNYKRRLDVVHQTQLIRPDIYIAGSLDGVIGLVKQGLQL